MLRTATLGCPRHVALEASPHARAGHGISLLVSLGIAFAIPKQYKSTTSIMPPDQQSSSAMMLAALAARSGRPGSLGSLAGGLLGGHTSTASVHRPAAQRNRERSSDRPVQSAACLPQAISHRYGETSRACTKITEDKKSGVITIEVEDTDRERARDLAQGYLDELNNLVMRTNTSAAHRERVFIEQRLQKVQADLETSAA